MSDCFGLKQLKLLQVLYLLLSISYLGWMHVWNASILRPFPRSFYLCFKTSPKSHVDCHANTFSFEWFRAWPRYETEAKGNLEMAYYYTLINECVHVCDYAPTNIEWPELVVTYKNLGNNSKL